MKYLVYSFLAAVISAMGYGCQESVCLSTIPECEWVTDYSNCTQYSCDYYDSSGNCQSQSCIGYGQVQQCTDQCAEYGTEYGDVVTISGNVSDAMTGMPIGNIGLTQTDPTNGNNVSSKSGTQGNYSINMFVYDDAHGNLDSTVCTQANQLYPSGCTTVSRRDSCNQPSIGGTSFSLTPNYNAPAIVRGFYRDLLHRSPSAQEMSAQLSQLQGESREQLALALLNTTEYRGILLQSFAQHYLKKPLSRANLAKYLGYLKQGLTDEQIQYQIIISPQYASRLRGVSAFISAVYRDILGRSASSSEMSQWTKKLKRNSSQRRALVLSLLGSSEHRTEMANAWFQSYLHRAVDGASLAVILSTFSGGATDEHIQAGILGAAEYLGLQQ